MEVELRKLDDLSIELRVSGCPLPILNVVRRYALAKVPCMAVDYVRIYDNTSALFDEILAHRLAMIPLTSEEALEKYRDPGPDVCRNYIPVGVEIPEELEGEEVELKPDVEEKCFVRLTLEASAERGERVVYSGEIKSDVPFVKPVYDNIPIVVLAPGQRIKLELYARLGRGLEHAKWSPATVAVVRYIVDVVIDEARCNACGKCVERCPRGVLAMENGKVVVKNVIECIACKQCVAACPTKVISVKPRGDDYVLYIESSGALKPETIVREALKILINELDALSKEASKWREAKVG